MKARVLEMQEQQGWGRAQLDDGRVLPFDVTACTPAIPAAGVEAEVELGLSRLGTEKITRLVIIPQWEADTLAAVFLRTIGPRESELYVVDGLARNPFTSQPMTSCSRVRLMSPEASPWLETGAHCCLRVEVDRSSQNTRTWRATSWHPGAIAPDAEQALFKGFFAEVVDAWESWESPDGCHCADCRATLRDTVFLGIDLGLAVKKHLTIRDYPEQGPGSAYEEMRAPVTTTTTLARPRS